MKRSILAAVTVALLSSTAAVAADVYGKGGLKDRDEPKVVAVEADKSWTGIWVGAFGGYTMTNTELSVDHTEGHIAGLDGIGGEGLFGEVQLGFDKQLSDRFVVGVFGGAGLSNSETELTIGSGSATVEEGPSYLAGVRLGFLATKNSMVYVAGGWRWTESELTAGSFTLDEEWDGAFGEAGLETRLTNNMYLRVAGRYTAFQDIDYPLSQDINLNVDPGKLEAMAGITFKFGGGQWNFND